MVVIRRYSFVIFIGLFFAIILLINVYFVLTIIEDYYISLSKSEGNVFTANINNNYVSNHKFDQTLKKIRRLGRFYVTSGDNQLVASINASKKLKNFAEKFIITSFKNTSRQYEKILKGVISDLNDAKNHSLDLWKIAENWVTGNQVLPEVAPLLGSILNSLHSAKILKADNAKKGTQLKLLLTLEGGHKALFKPQWYSRDKIIRGPVYAGKDRHNAEIAAFHLSLLLNIRKVPLTTGRKINLRKEIVPVATPELLNTFYDDGTNTCFYGVCLYCEPKSPVCAKNDIMEGALIMWLPSKISFERYPHPWQRSYKKGLVARWEVEENYCEKVKLTKQYDPHLSSRLLDLIDGVVFDFLLDNGDRHHYEVPMGFHYPSVFLFDNGKSFGNPFEDHLDILAPLYQCCIIRKTTWKRLKMFSGGSLSISLEKTLNYSHISSVLSKAHLAALDRRLLFILAAVEICIKEKGVSHVFSSQ